jgi:hypothetical protein
VVNSFLPSSARSFIGLVVFVSLTKLLFTPFLPITTTSSQDEVPSSRSGFGAVYAVAHGGVYCGLVQYHYQYLHSELAGT